MAALAGIALVLAQSAADLVAVLAFHSYDSLVDLDRSNALPDVVSVGIILSAAVGSAVLSTRLQAGRWAATALVVALVLIAAGDAAHLSDDASTVHGRVVIAALACVALLGLRVALTTRRTSRICMFSAIALLAVDVKIPFAYDQLMNATGNPWVGRGDVLYELGIVLDEGIEAAAWILLAVGLWIAVLEAKDAGAVVAGSPAS